MLGEPQFERVEDDFYPTPPENLDCLGTYLDLESLVVWEPACGEGDLSKRLVELGTQKVISTDLVDRGFGVGGIDFLQCPTAPGALLNYGNKRFAIITNPPYLTLDLEDAQWAHLRDLAARYGYTKKSSLADLFVHKALELAKDRNGIVAMFLRNEWDCAKERMNLFEDHPAYAMKVIVTKRPRWIKGSTGSPRHTYSWFVWDWSKPPETQAVIRYIHPKLARPCGAI